MRCDGEDLFALVSGSLAPWTILGLSSDPRNRIPSRPTGDDDLSPLASTSAT